MFRSRIACPVPCDFTARCPHPLRENSIQSCIVRCFRSFEFSVNSHSRAMQIIKCFIVASILIVRIYKAQVVIPTSSLDESTSDLVESVVKMITSCYGDQINTVSLAGNLPDTLTRTLSVQHLIPITLMDDGSRESYGTAVKVVHPRFRYKLPVFIVEASTARQLAFIIQFNIMTSIWWNHMATFVILDLSQEFVNLKNVLFIAWRLNLLNAKVMCNHHKYGGHIFNYNPFTSQAPVPWIRTTVMEGINKHPFTLFRRTYQGDETLCMNLDFVKTKNLGGCEIHLEGNAEFLEFSDKETPGLSRIVAERKRLLYMIFSAPNVNPKFSGLNRDVVPGDIEMTIQHVALRKEQLPLTYPYQQIGIVLVTKFRGHKSQLEKILYVIDSDSRIGMGLVYLVTLIFFKFFVHRALGPALLNLVRITCNTGFTNLPDNTAARMYLTGLLFFVVTMQGIYQGNLTSLLTNAIPVRNVNTFEDLVNFGYKLYGSDGMDAFIEDARVKEVFVQTIDVTKCITYVLPDSLAACITFAQGDTFDDAHRNDLHLSKRFLEHVSVGFPIRRFWYLEEQINTILGTIMEADSFETWETKCNPTKLADFEFDKEVRGNVDFKAIEFVELRFAFIILGIGLLGASVTFIVK